MADEIRPADVPDPWDDLALLEAIQESAPQPKSFPPLKQRVLKAVQRTRRRRTLRETGHWGLAGLALALVGVIVAAFQTLQMRTVADRREPGAWMHAPSRYVPMVPPDSPDGQPQDMADWALERTPDSPLDLSHQRWSPDN